MSRRAEDNGCSNKSKQTHNKLLWRSWVENGENFEIETLNKLNLLAADLQIDL